MASIHAVPSLQTTTELPSEVERKDFDNLRFLNHRQWLQPMLYPAYKLQLNCLVRLKEKTLII